jgi:membrane-associated phospholipid phosphatase
MNWKMFSLLTALAFVLMLSWLEPGLRIRWDALDVSVFRLFNNSMSTTGLWNNFWAVMNSRLSDLIALIIMTLFLIIPGLVFPADKLREGFFGFIILLFFMLIVREALDAFVELFSLNRTSPTLSLNNTFRLSEMYPQLSLKDRSWESFPGDHAGVAMLWLGYCLSFTRNKWSIVAVLVTLIFLLPRLVSGGHWLSDDLVGGGVIALLTLA